MPCGCDRQWSSDLPAKYSFGIDVSVVNARTIGTGPLTDASFLTSRLYPTRTKLDGKSLPTFTRVLPCHFALYISMDLLLKVVRFGIHRDETYRPCAFSRLLCWHSLGPILPDPPFTCNIKQFYEPTDYSFLYLDAFSRIMNIARKISRSDFAMSKKMEQIRMEMKNPLDFTKRLAVSWNHWFRKTIEGVLNAHLLSFFR